MIDVKEKRVFCFPVEIVKAAQKEGISLDTLSDMVKHSTRITHPQGNRRYNGWLFMVEGNDVLGFGRIQETGQEEERPKVHEALSSVDTELDVCEACHGKRTVPAFDPCERCEGTGCKYCNEGLIPRPVPCPACAV